MKVGIDQISYYIPKIALSIDEFAKNKDLEVDKLKLGLGLSRMALMDVHEDTATMCANALLNLFKDSDLNPKDIGRIYLGTESSLDGAKPTATYSVQLIETQLAEKFGEDCLRNCDVLDATFACIGGVDFLQNSLDYIRVNPTKKAIVIAGDYAKYALNSSGEYTQGAGVVALVLSANPSIMSFENQWGIATKSEHDFFKPRRYFNNDSIKLKTTKKEVEIFSDEPIFDGQFSNKCYQDRIREAYFNLKEVKGSSEILHKNWDRLIFHLPYSFHGRRIFSEIYAMEQGHKLEDLNKDLLKEISKSDEYKEFLKNKITPAEKASSEVGNLYTASIFMAMLSTLKVADIENRDITGNTFGFIAYGSGSKAKVFEGKVENNWKEKISNIHLFETLESRKDIDFTTYEKLHNKELKESILAPKDEFILQSLETENPNQLGARYYDFVK